MTTDLSIYVMTNYVKLIAQQKILNFYKQLLNYVFC